ncbi:DNA topoisomerase IB [Oleiagrimonas sp. C23AA]|uniref:DNA topoisomerase IB n=1 Tax=Oleiagrimonas sp. C23AA TaxID=2719047 RepID=UPI00141E75F2|nr:DNA topoisomerase IB [Oleiagrimonas sp. C23AA]NII11313.1 DNA topoisomerase IB [Oleiagrimonas sp. C23AA]
MANADRSADPIDLIHVCDTDPGIRRRRHGKGFAYRHDAGHAVRDEETLARIRDLAIPPAYEQVWICDDARGHLQATGRDARQRKQYRYHPHWQRLRERDKFTRVVEFGQALPRLRRRLIRDLKQPGLPRDKVLALILAVLDETLIRIGNEAYARDNGAFGATTLRNRHVQVRHGRLYLHFRGKSGQSREVALDDARLRRLIKRLRRLPGQRLFQYQDDAGARQPVDSGQVNDYLHQVMGEPFSAKDFRTFGGTVRAVVELARTPLPEPFTEHAAKRAIAAAVKRVAEMLGNTPAVCRKSYIHPDVFEGWQDGTLHALVDVRSTRYPRQRERRALAFLKAMREKAAASQP